MVYRFIYGKPIETEAILKKPEVVPDGFKVPYLTKIDNGYSFGYSFRMDEHDIVYGLGENVRGINKRGWVYVSNCSDEPAHREDTRSLYGAHNFLIVDGTVRFGIFVDTSGKVTFDIGYTGMDTLSITLENKDHELYIMEGESPDQIVTSFRKLTGSSYIPPKWAFGYGQSRWSYLSADEVREVVQSHRDNGLPLDSVYLDIDYMEAYKDFTVNQETFPDFQGFVAEMHREGIHLVPIIDAGVKIEDGYDIYEEGREKGYFCKGEDGEDFVIGVWPGRCVLPDMLNEEARKWFGSQYQILLEQGIDGFWNDMNEPAVFYSEKRLNKVFSMLQEYQKQDLDIRSYFEFKDLVNTLSNNNEDYQSFYHSYRGQRIRHDKVHNLFGYYMTRAAAEAFDRLVPDKRILMFSRASSIGMHRYGGIWTGDNLSWWSHLEMNMKMLPSLNMCGFLYTGADIGGFGADVTQDLMLRWLALGIFTPLMRNHSAVGTRRQEAYTFDDIGAFRDILSLRYRLLPYLYSEYMKAALADGMYCRPMGFVYPEDDIARRIEDQLLIGTSIMIAPIYKQNEKGRVVYCPEEMKLLRFRGGDVTEERLLEKGHHYLSMELDEVLVFIRKGQILPLGSGGRNVAETDFDNLTMYHLAEEGACYEQYYDDGDEKTVNLHIQDHIRVWQL